jgi:membrane associated rhomboid family serine protease
MPLQPHDAGTGGEGRDVKVNAVFRLPGEGACDIRVPRSETIGFTAKTDLELFLFGRAGGSAGRSGKFPGRLFFVPKLIFETPAKHANRVSRDWAHMQEPAPDGKAEAREPIFFLPKIITAAIILCAGLYALEAYLLSERADALLLNYMAFVPARFAAMGLWSPLEFVRAAVTCSLLHASFAHLAVNLIWLAAFGAPLAQRLGALRFAAFWVFTALCSTALHFVTHLGDLSPLVGASGVVSGAMGSAARFGFATRGNSGPRAFSGAPLTFEEALRSRSVISFVLVWALVNFASGAGALDLGQGSASIAWQAHIGGFLAGFFGLRLFDRNG